MFLNFLHIQDHIISSYFFVTLIEFFDFSPLLHLHLLLLGLSCL